MLVQARCKQILKGRVTPVIILRYIEVTAEKANADSRLSLGRGMRWFYFLLTFSLVYFHLQSHI